MFSDKELFSILEEKYYKYNNLSFIESDPISIPHMFDKKEDIEISGFLSSSIAWGQRKSIINNSTKLVKLMDYKPYDFIINATESDFNLFSKFVHRTFNDVDCVYFLKSLQNIYKNHNGLEEVFTNSVVKHKDIKRAMIDFRKIFFELPYQTRTLRHISNPEANSAAKRINMFLRWMVRKDKNGVDFGIWAKIKPSQLYIPLDVHTRNISMGLGLLNRKQPDWKAVDELTSNLRKFDKNDPVKYDFALFGTGVDKDNKIVK